MARLAVSLGLGCVGALWLGAGAARADSFGGFSGVDRPYLVNQDKICTPVLVADGAAHGMPKCETAPADRVAHLSIKPPAVQTGADASFGASAAGRTITVTRKTGDVLVRWDAPDPIGKIVEVYASQYEDRVAVAYTVRRAGRELTDVIAFDLGQAGAAITPTVPTTTTPVAPVAPVVVGDPKLAAAVKAARTSHGGGAWAAWAKVLAIDPHHAEALFRQAVIGAQAHHDGDALEALAALASSPNPDAIEWRIEARFDPAFAKLRADARFRAAVGLDAKTRTAYERFMGVGGQWEQTGTSCDKAEVRLTALRDRTFKLRVKTACEGQIANLPFHGTWRVEGDAIVLTLPTQGVAASAADDAGCQFEAHGDEDGLHCVIGRDLDFLALPTRR